MKNVISLILAGFLFSCSATAPATAARFGTSYGSRSYSSPSRSYSAPRPSAPVARPAPAVTKNVTVNKTTVVHEHYNNPGSGNGLLTGVLLGEALSNNRNTVVMQPPAVVAAQPQIVEQAPVQVAPTVIPAQHEEDSHLFLWFCIVMLLGAILFYFLKPKNNS